MASKSCCDCLQERKVCNLPKLDAYEIRYKIGQGTFGAVYKALCKKTKRIVALKRVLMSNETEGFPLTALREIKYLQKLQHENVLELLSICYCDENKTNFYMVFEYCEHDLAGIVGGKNGVTFTSAEIKEVMRQLLNGLSYLHACKVLHRDLKTANILVTKDGKIKLADFGLSRAYSSNVLRPVCYTNCVVTLWYRPPELLLGTRNYSDKIDIWGAGCIMAELWLGRPLLQGQSETSQLRLINALCGPISSEVWPDVAKLPRYGEIEENLLKKSQPLDQQLRRLGVDDPCAIDLVQRMLVLDPAKRVSALEALLHPVFYKSPRPLPLAHTLSKLKTSQNEMAVCTQRKIEQRGIKRKHHDIPVDHTRDHIF